MGGAQWGRAINLPVYLLHDEHLLFRENPLWERIQYQNRVYSCIAGVTHWKRKILPANWISSLHAASSQRHTHACVFQVDNILLKNLGGLYSAHERQNEDVPCSTLHSRGDVISGSLPETHYSDGHFCPAPSTPLIGLNKFCSGYLY